MRNPILTAALVLSVGINCLAQQSNPVYNATNFLEGIYDVNANFYEVKAAGEAYFAQDSLLKEGNGHGYKDFLRYLNYFEPRVYNDATVTGDLNKYHELIHNYSQNRSSVCNDPTGLTGLYNWNFIGPKDLPDQYLGMITSVAYFDDNGTDVIFAGSAAGGVFKAIYDPSNTSLTWDLITEDIEVPGIGFSDLRVLDDSNGSGK